MKLIEVNNISKKYDRKILDKVSFDVNKGEIIAITGESGSGKTTLLNILSMIDNDFDGEISYNDLNQESVGFHRNDSAFIFQNFGLVENESVEFNLKIALKFTKLNKNEWNKKMQNALEKVGLEKISLKSKISSLSGGEQQRVACARVLLKNPKIIFADEPTGNLDEHNGEKIFQILNEFSENGTTVIIVTHNLELAKKCNRILKISNGKIK